MISDLFKTVLECVLPLEMLARRGWGVPRGRAAPETGDFGDMRMSVFLAVWSFTSSSALSWSSAAIRISSIVGCCWLVCWLCSVCSLTLESRPESAAMPMGWAEPSTLNVDRVCTGIASGP